MSEEHHDPREQVYVADQRHKNFWGKVTPWENRDPVSAEDPDAYEQRQRSELGDGLTFRAGAAMPGTYYMSHDHEQLKKMVTDNVDIGATHEIGHTWNDLGNILVGVHADLRNAVNSSADAWQGTAADAARQHISGMADTVGVNAKACQYAANSVAQQADAVAKARNMPDPVQFSILDAMKMVATEPNPFKMPQVIGQIQQKFDQKQQAHAEAAQMMSTMETSMGQAISTMPAFVTEAPPRNQPPPEKKPQPGNDPGKTGKPGVGGNVPSGTFSTPGDTGTGQPAPAPMPPPSGGQPPYVPPQPAPVWHPGDQTYGQGAGSDPGGGRGGYPYPGGGSLHDRPGVGSPGGVGVAPVGPLGPGGLGGAGGGSQGYGGRAGRGGAVSGLGGVGEGASGGGRGGLGAGRGPGGTVGVGGTHEGGVAGRGGAGAAGAGGRAGAPGGMMGGGAGGAGGKGEDGEHQRPSYLVEADPDSIFGTDQKVAPPVIGE